MPAGGNATQRAGHEMYEYRAALGAMGSPPSGRGRYARWWPPPGLSLSNLVPMVWPPLYHIRVVAALRTPFRYGYPPYVYGPYGPLQLPPAGLCLLAWSE